MKADENQIELCVGKPYNTYSAATERSFTSSSSEKNRNDSVFEYFSSPETQSDMVKLVGFVASPMFVKIILVYRFNKSKFKSTPDNQERHEELQNRNLLD